MKRGIIVAILLLFYLNSFGQDSLVRKLKFPFFSYKNGLGVTTPDSVFSINFRFRIQSRVGYTSESETDFTPKEFDFRVRRIRLRIGGFILTPRLAYNIQLSFSRADMDWDVSTVPNVLRDAMITYSTRNGFTFGIGQTKLPGNRQRVISSGEQQFTDRSIVNNALTLDRDFGVFVNYDNHIGNFNFIIKTAISSGEGRNIISSDKGLAYTGRLEILPLGLFSEGGDYFEGDLFRESKPKLSIGGGAHFNHRAIRTGGQLGQFLYQPRNMISAFADFVFKFKGFALSSEYIYRNSPNPITVDTTTGNVRFVYSGQGVNSQISYCFKKMYEIGFRHSILIPDSKIWNYENMKNEYTLVFSKYFMRHRLKIQTDLTWHREFNLILHQNQSQKNFLQWKFQVELGI